MCAHMLTGSNNESVYMMLHLVLWPILITHGVMLMKSMHTQVPAHKYTILKVGQTHTHTHTQLPCGMCIHIMTAMKKQEERK